MDEAGEKTFPEAPKATFTVTIGDNMVRGLGVGILNKQ
jgi:hypothetical protein